MNVSRLTYEFASGAVAACTPIDESHRQVPTAPFDQRSAIMDTPTESLTRNTLNHMKLGSAALPHP